MLWGEIRDRVVERLAEYQAGAAEASGNGTFATATLYKRISTAYRRMLRHLARTAPNKVSKLSDTFTYASASESITMPDQLRYRDIFSLERAVGSSWEPIENVTDWQEQQSRINSTWVTAVDVPTRTSYGYREEMDRLYVVPAPQESLTLRARFFGPVTTLTEANKDDTPIVIQEEHHDLLALLAARSLMGETRSNEELEKEFRDGWEDFNAWCTGSPKRGPRFIHERD